jgi:hypothetical protein
MLENSRSVVFRRDHDSRVAVNEALTEKAGHGRKETFIVSIELDGMMMVVYWATIFHLAQC